MKRKVFIPLVAAALVLPLAACGGEEEVYFGFAADAKYSVGYAGFQTDVDAVSALFDKDGKVLDLKIDAVQVKTAATEAEVVTLAADGYNEGSDIKSKFELGSDYAMKDTSAAIGVIEGGAEWNEQSIAFEEWAVGKTVSEIEAAVNNDGKLSDGASIGNTIVVSYYTDALKDAFASKKLAAGANASSKVGLGIFTGHEDLQSTVNLAGVVLAKDETVAASTLDVYQIPYVVTESEGAFTVGINESAVQVDKATSSIKSKAELGPDYNMKDTSAAIGVIEGGAEWDEQAENWEAWAVGKTATEIAEIELNGGKPKNGGEIGVTITVTDFLEVYAEAAALAKSGR